MGNMLMILRIYFRRFLHIFSYLRGYGRNDKKRCTVNISECQVTLYHLIYFIILHPSIISNQWTSHRIA